MSTDDTAFDTLGRVIAEGGLHVARVGLERHQPGPLFLAYLARRFPSLRPAEVDTLSTLTQQYRTAGVILAQLETSGTISDEVIPIAPDIFGAVTGGLRYEIYSRVRMRSQETGTERWVTATVAEPVMPTVEDIQAIIDALLTQLWSKYREAKLFGMEEDWDQMEVQFLGVARKF